jgi:hypothetical protein
MMLAHNRALMSDLLAETAYGSRHEPVTFPTNSETMTMIHLSCGGVNTPPKLCFCL